MRTRARRKLANCIASREARVNNMRRSFATAGSEEWRTWNRPDDSTSKRRNSILMFSSSCKLRIYLLPNFFPRRFESEFRTVFFLDSKIYLAAKRRIENPF